MQPASAQARQRISDSLDGSELTIILDGTGSPSSRLRGRCLGPQGETLRVQVPAALGESLVVGVAGEIDTGSGRQPLLGKYRVRSCKLSGIGRYLVELTMEPVAHEPPPKEPSRAPEVPDYYEILQVSRRADTETIHRVFHLMVQRYHPDNRDTGNQERFRQLVEAHEVLCDVERRAAHDVRLASEDKVRHRIFDSLQSTQGVQAEIRKRKGILRLLYGKRLTDPYKPSMEVRDLVEMLGCPAEHLEFSFWYLRENNLIRRSDNNRVDITSQGVESFESEEGDFAKRPVLTLPAASSA